ncbi:MAG: hypothetical protein ACK5TN_03200 [Acidobacteriota bacterium]
MSCTPGCAQTGSESGTAG